MSKNNIEAIIVKVQKKAAELFANPEVFFKDEYQEGDEVIRLVLVSPSFDGKNCNDQDFCYSVREKLKLGQLQGEDDPLLVLIQPLSLETFVQFNRDIKEATRSHQDLSPASQPNIASPTDTASDLSR